MRINLVRLMIAFLLLIVGIIVMAAPGLAWKSSDFPLLGGLIVMCLGIAMLGLSVELKSK